ncbi:MAG: HisA/HisF family protein [Thermoleophilia bacterium]
MRRGEVSSLELIPVLDLKEGLVVHAVRGDRRSYRPIESLLTASKTPLDVAKALVGETGALKLYVADLDALGRTGHHEKQIERLAQELSVELWVDAGTIDRSSAHRLLALGTGRVVVGTESMSGLEALDVLAGEIGPRKLVPSLDLRRRELLKGSASWQVREPLQLLRQVVKLGLDTVILLSLDRVGTKQGPDLSLAEAARRALPELNLIIGGGVRDHRDVLLLQELGIQGALVATALHSGALTRGGQER